MKNGIKGKVVAITGASSGIGAATALLLAAEGAKIVLGARREERLKDLAERIAATGGQAAYIVTDVKKREDLKAMVDLACSKFGTLDVLINNAGIAHLSRIDDLQVEDWEEMIDVNLKGVLYGIAAALPVFRRQDSGHIINIISTSGIKIVPTQGIYAGAKNAVRTISEAFRQESDGRLRVTGISPGMVQTELATIGMKNSDIKAAIIGKMSSMAISPETIARTVAFAIEQPDDVEIGDIVIRPASQN